MNAKPRPMSNQQAFDNVWQHFIVERHPLAYVTNPEGRVVSCLYRTGDGENGCAIGCQIPDEMVRAQRLVDDNPSVATMLEDHAMCADYFAHCDDEFLGQLQGAHDDVAVHGGEDKHEQLRARLVTLASEHGLVVPTV